MPPHTILGYSHEGVRAGAMDTPSHWATPFSPNCHTTRLLARPPIHPAEKQIIRFFMMNRSFDLFSVYVTNS
jgi:hypothetical protein